MNTGFLIKLVHMKYSWKIAGDADYPSLYQCASSLRWNIEHITRRLVIPLSLGHLISFYDEIGRLAGFLTLAFLNPVTESHQATIGILPADWKSGNRLWVVDLVAPNGGCAQMLRAIVKDINRNIIHAARYFRLKHNQVREVVI